MTKKDLTDLVREITQCNTVQAQAAVTAVFDTIRMGVKTDRHVVIKGFGTFKLTIRKAKLGRNPKTGEAVQIPERQAMTFKEGKKDTV